MGFFDSKKDMESKLQAIIDDALIKAKHGENKNIEPFANKEEMKEAFANLVNSVKYHVSTAFSKKTYVTTTLKEEVEDFLTRVIPLLTNNGKVFKKA